MREELSTQESVFVFEYLTDFNHRRAAQAAGIDPNRGQRLRQTPRVRAAITEALNARQARLEITADVVAEELIKIAFSDIRQAVAWNKDEVIILDSDMLDDATAAAISEVSMTKDGIKIKFHDKRAALVDVGKHLGMFKDKIEHSADESLAGLLAKSYAARDEGK